MGLGKLMKMKQVTIISLFGILLFIQTPLLAQIFVPQSGNPEVMKEEKYEGDPLENDNYYLQDTTQKRPTIEVQEEEVKINPFLSGRGVKQGMVQENGKNRSNYLHGGTEKPTNDDLQITDKEIYTQGSGHLAGKDYKNEIEKNLTTFQHNVPYLARSNWGLYFSKDDANYQGGEGDVFNKTFRYKKHSGYGLSTSYNRFWWFGWGHWGIGGNLAILFSQGKGSFKNQEDRSRTTVTLWSVPLDFSLSYDLPLVVSWLKLGVSGGPSAMFLLQNRSDRGAGEKGRNVYNMSSGYFGQLHFKWDLLSLFTHSRRDFVRRYGSTSCYLTVQARRHEYKHFQQKDIKIAGNLYSVGFTFDYL